MAVTIKNNEPSLIVRVTIWCAMRVVGSSIARLMVHGMREEATIDEFFFI